MAGLKNKLKQLTSQKSEISKIRRKGETEYKKVKSMSRKYSSSLKSTQKRIDTFKQTAEDVNEMLSQKIAQMESIQRLKSAAQERLTLETQNKEQVEKMAKEALEELNKIKEDAEEPPWRKNFLRR